MNESKKLGVQVENVNQEELFNVISAATSQEPWRVQASSTRLKEMMDMFGTYDGLHEIASQKSVAPQIRQQAIIQFKNAALAHWKSRKVLNDEHRTRVRTRCMAFLSEEDDTIAQVNEIIMARLARQDFPTAWPNLITELTQIINTNMQLHISGNPDSAAYLVLRRSLKALNSIIKEFASIKLPGGIQTMAQITGQLHGGMFLYYSQLSASLSALTPNDLGQQRTPQNLLIAHLVYKCLVKMGVWVYGQFGKTGKARANIDDMQGWLAQLFQASSSQAKTLLDLRTQLVVVVRSPTLEPIVAKSLDQLTRHVRVFGKLFRRMQQLDTTRFVLLPGCSELVLFYWEKVVQATNSPPDYVEDSNTAVYPVRLLVQAMVLFKDNLAQWTPVRKNGTPNELTLPQEFVEEAVRLLVTRFMPLNPADLEGWMADPEEWVNMEDRENEQWEYELRPCGERVLVTLSSQYKQYVTPLLETTFKQIVGQPTEDLASVVQKEAIYCAIGRCATRLKDVIPFTEWLKHNLVAEAQSTNANFPIIKRRIAWLIGKWIGDSCSPPSDPNIWKVLIHLLHDRGPGTDAVVRLTAAHALRECVDTVEFDISVFAPYLPTAATELLKLVNEADAIESKRRLVDTLNVVIQRGDQWINPHAQLIADAIPSLWTDADEEWLLKASLLVTVTSLVEATKDHSPSLHGLIIPLIRESLSPKVAVHLDEDGLNLWTMTIRNASTLTSAPGQPSLLELFPLALSLMSEHLDLLGSITSIIESYIILDATTILQNFAVQLFQAALTPLAGQAISANIRDILVVFQFVAQCAPASLWGEALHISGVFPHIVRILEDEKSSTLIYTECVYLLARIALADRQMLLQLVAAVAQSKNVPEATVFEIVLDQWWRQFDHMSEPRHRKLVAIGMASLVSTGRPEVLDRLPNEIFNMWTDVLYEIKESQNLSEDSSDGNVPLIRHWDLDEVPHSFYNGSENTLEYTRRQELLNRDPVKTMQLVTIIGSALQQAEQVCGSVAFKAQYLDKTEKALINQIQDELQKKSK